MMSQGQGLRFQPGDKVTPTQPEEGCEGVAGTVFFLGDHDYVVQYPSEDRKMYGWEELRPACPAEFVRYERRRLGLQPMPVDDPDYPRWDSAREVWTGPLAAQTTLREPATGYTATVLVAGDQVTATYHDPEGAESGVEEVDDDEYESLSAFGVARGHVARLQSQGWVLT